MLDFWKKIRDNLSRFFLDQKLLSLIDEMDKKIENIESKIELKEEQNIKQVYAKPIVPSKKIENSFNNDKKEKNIIINTNIKKENDDNDKKNELNINNLESNIFHYNEEKLGENIFEITKNNQNIISFIEIDLFLQKLANGENIYDDVIKQNNLIDGFCIQHSAFISTNVLISKIISCFNYFYSRYLNQDDDSPKESIGIRRRYERLKLQKNKNIFNTKIKKIPFNIIDLLIIFIDLHNTYNRNILTQPILEKVKSFYQNILEIYDIKNRYEKEILKSMDILNQLSSLLILKRTQSEHNKIPYENLFPKNLTLNDIITSSTEPKSFFDILNYNSKEIASELTYISYKLFYKIEPKEFLKGVFTKKNKNVTSPNIIEISYRFNKLSYWIIEEILMYDNESDRAKVIVKVIDIINELILMNNLFDSLSLSSGLSHLIINNLEKTWKYISKENKEKFKNIKQILSFQDNYRNIKNIIEDCSLNNKPYIPFLGPYNKTICYLEEYGPYIKDNSLINVDKIVLVQQVLEQLYKFKSTNYLIVRPSYNEFFLFQCLDPVSEDELEKLASFIEPNFVLYDKKQNKKRASNSEKNFKENYIKKNDFV